jgi:hypothetical protein
MTLKQTETPGPVQIEQTTNRTNKFETARKCPAATCIVRKNVAARSPGPCSSLSPSTAQKHARKHASLDELHVRRVAAHGWQWEAAVAEQHEQQRVTFGLEELKHASCGRLGPIRPHHRRAVLGNGRKENLGRCERLLRLAQLFRAGH